MINDRIKEKINEVLTVDFEIPEEKLQPDAALFTDLELDSLDIVDLIVALEKAFNIKIRTESAEAFRDVRTLNDLYTVVQNMYEKLTNEQQN
jgi:acyl carrier protein